MSDDLYMDARADELLEGPRGRRMLYELSQAETLREALASSAASALYWQEPDDTDVMLADASFAEPLRAVAEQVAAAPEAQWLWLPLAAEQFVVRWFTRDFDTDRELEPQPVDPGATAAQLARWRQLAGKSEARFRGFRLDDPDRLVIGDWWSLPQFLCVWSAPTLGALGPAALHFIEDDMGFAHARVTPMLARAEARVLEIAGPADWAGLCRRHPFDVSESRRSVWGATTGREGRWVLPDWPAVAREWDAVHVTGAGYLRAAGRAIPVDDETATVLAGWEPGLTVWLTDAVERAGDPVAWVRVADEWGLAG